MNLNQIQKKIWIPIIFGVVIIITAFIILIALSSNQKQISNPSNPQVTPQNQQPILKPIETRSQLPANIQAIKKQIIDAKIGTDNGDIVLYKSADFKIEYIPTPDFFLVTIFKEPQSVNKKSAEDWFLKKGLSRSDLCNLPVRFSNNLPNAQSQTNFNPFPQGCQ